LNQRNCRVIGTILPKMKTQHTRLLLDAYFTRPSPPLFLPTSGGAYTFEPKPSDRPSDLSLKEQEFAILHPRFFIPTHLGGLGQPITGGLDASFNPSTGFMNLLESYETVLVNRGQFMDTFVLDAKGVTPTPNHAVKQSLGMSDVQGIPTP
jgi:hypothetical protein